MVADIFSEQRGHLLIKKDAFYTQEKRPLTELV